MRTRDGSSDRCFESDIAMSPCACREIRLHGQSEGASHADAVSAGQYGSSEEQLLGDKRGLFAHPYLIMGNLFDCTSWLGLDKIGRDFSVACLVT